MSSPDTREGPASSNEICSVVSSVQEQTMAGRAENRVQHDVDNASDIKEEPKDDIKNFAEDTMNELLGWYGYDKHSQLPVDPNRLLKKRRKEKERFPIRSKANSDDDEMRQTPSDDAARMSETDEERGLLQTVQTSSARPPMLVKEKQDGEAGRITELPEKCFVVCTWCQKGKTLDKHYIMMTREGERKFCSDQCFSQCRREKYKKQKVCEWCKGTCIATKSVEYEDGTDTFLFCSDNCLNKYKMDIFCQETQEHMKRSKSDGAPLPPTTSDSRILITPELWVEEMNQTVSQQQWPETGRKLEDTTNKLRSISQPLSERSRHKHRLVSRSPNADGMLRVVALKAKAELEHPKIARTSTNNRPPRMTDREKIKQIRMRDKLPLNTPLRETYRGNTHTDIYTIQHLTGERGSPGPVSSAFNSIGGPLSQAMPIPTLSQMSPLSASQLYGALANHSMRPLSNQSVSPNPEHYGENGDSCSSQSTSPRMSSADQGQAESTPAPPLYPPPNPFTQALPSYFNLPNGPMPFPAAPSLASLSALGGLYPPPLMPPAMTNLMPPNTLMMPYPFILPLPIPIPIPIPIPQRLMDAALRKEKVPSNQSSDNDSKDNIIPIYRCKNGCVNSSESHTSRVDGGLSCSNCRATPKDTNRRRSTSPNELRQRYFLGDNKKSIETDRAIDLSTDSGRFRRRSVSPASGNITSGMTPSPVVIQPNSDTGSELSPGPATSPFAMNPMLNCSNPRYSSRRSLILDAPATTNDTVRSPSPAEKRSYNGASVRDILYGKRKCARPRIKTK